MALRSETTGITAQIPRFAAWGARVLVATLLACGLVMAPVYAANHSVQGAVKKEEGGVDTDAPTAILIEAKSGSVLFE